MQLLLAYICAQHMLSCCKHRYYTDRPASVEAPRIISLNDEAWTFKLFDRPEHVPKSFFDVEFKPDQWDQVCEPRVLWQIAAEHSILSGQDA